MICVSLGFAYGTPKTQRRRNIMPSKFEPACPKPLAERSTNAYLRRRRVLPFSYAVKFQWPYIIRGSWLCLNLGSFTWCPPVHTGPRELSYQHGCTGGPATFVRPSSFSHKALIQSAISRIEASAALSLPHDCK